MDNNYMKDRNQPYERFLDLGASALTESELLAIILRTGTKGVNALQLSQNILALGRCQNGLLDLYDITLDELTKLNGVGIVKAVKIQAILELSKRIATSNAKVKVKIDSPNSVADYFMERMRHLQREIVYLVVMDTKNQIVSEQVLSIGTINMSLLSPREVFLVALRNNASSIILLHNHPSGDCSPSEQDICITKKILEVGKTLEIPLLDHIIIGDNKYFSFKEKRFI